MKAITVNRTRRNPQPMDLPSKVLIIGYGEMGHIMKYLLRASIKRIPAPRTWMNTCQRRYTSHPRLHTLEMVSRYRLFDTALCPLYGLIRDTVTAPLNVARNFENYLDIIRKQGEL